MRLELKIMLEAEGGTKEDCMKLLRHEAGHALCYAYHLNRKRSWQNIFGKPNQEYGDTYKFRPYSKSYVRHLDNYYAQFHPDEDYAETFAVWLTPNLDWKKSYKGWQALDKLLYVDQLMQSIQGKKPLVSTGKPFWKASSSRLKLESFYRKKRNLQAEQFPDFHDPNLRRIFVNKEEAAKGAQTAGKMIQKHRRMLLNTVAQWTGEKRYTTDALIRKIHARCQDLKLYCLGDEDKTLSQLTSYLTTLLMNYRYTGWYRGDKRK